MLSSLFDPKLLGTITVFVGGGLILTNVSGGKENNKCAKPSWLIDSSDPIMDCQQNGKHYKVFLTSSGTIDKSGGGIHLQLFDVNNNKYINLKGSENQFLDEQGKWFQTVGQSIGSWRILQNNTFIREINLMTPKIGTSVNSIIKCQTLKIQNKTDRKDLNENLADIKFEVKNCSKDNEKEVCDLTIVSSSKKLEWTSDFKPKVAFCNLAHHQKLQ